jgi:hypothetical protein
MASRTRTNARSKFDVARQRLLHVLDRFPPDEDNDEEFNRTTFRRGDDERWADDLAEATDGYLAELFQLAPGAEAEMRRRSKGVQAATAAGSEYAKAEAACAFILEPRFIPEGAPESQAARRGLGSGAFALDRLRPMHPAFVAKDFAELYGGLMLPEPVDPVFVVFSVERRADVVRSLLEVGDDVQFSDDEREKLQAWMTAAQKVARDGRNVGADGCALMLDLRARWQSAIPKGERPAGWVLAQVWTPHVADAVRDSVEAIGRFVDELWEADGDQVQVTPAKLREWLCISQETLRKRATDGTYPIKIISEKLWLAPKSFIDQCKATAAARSTPRPAPS